MYPPKLLLMISSSLILMVSVILVTDLKGASHFCKSITQSNDKQRSSAPLKKANV